VEPRFVRYQAQQADDDHGLRPGVFRLVGLLRQRGALTTKQLEFVQASNAWYDAAYPEPGSVDPTIYDRAANPGAVAWFKVTGAQHLLERLPGYLTILDAHGVRWERVEATDPGQVLYEDDFQVVAAPR